MKALDENKIIKDENGLLKKENTELKNRLSQLDANSRNIPQNSRAGNNSANYKSLYRDAVKDSRELRSQYDALKKDFNEMGERYQNKENQQEQELANLKKENARLLSENTIIKNPPAQNQNRSSIANQGSRNWETEYKKLTQAHTKLGHENEAFKLKAQLDEEEFKKLKQELAQLKSQNRVPAPNQDQTDWKKKFEEVNVGYAKTVKENEKLSIQLKIHEDFAKTSYANDAQPLQIKEEKIKIEKENDQLQKELLELKENFKKYRSEQEQQKKNLSDTLLRSNKQYEETTNLNAAYNYQLRQYQGSLNYHGIDPNTCNKKPSSVQNQSSNRSSQQQRPVPSSGSN